MSNPVLHLNATVLPTDEPVDLWVADGTVSTEPLPGAETISRGGYVLPGLVDAHCHIGLDADGGVDVAASERQALIERRAGVLLIRDAGVPVDTHWIDDRT
ncbi:MAG: amidohydrolase, partial [Propionibacteriales bacterium]|nr:amidohydrolase [Propionibacteriales bacterium]